MEIHIWIWFKNDITHHPSLYYSFPWSNCVLVLSKYFTVVCRRTENCALHKQCCDRRTPDLGRSNLFGIIRKTRNLKFCGKRKNYTLQLTSILKRLTLTQLQAFTSRILRFLTEVLVSVWITIFYILSLSSHELGFFRRWKPFSAISYV